MGQRAVASAPEGHWHLRVMVAGPVGTFDLWCGDSYAQVLKVLGQYEEDEVKGARIVKQGPRETEWPCGHCLDLKEGK